MVHRETNQEGAESKHDGKEDKYHEGGYSIGETICLRVDSHSVSKKKRKKKQSEISLINEATFVKRV